MGCVLMAWGAGAQAQTWQQPSATQLALWPGGGTRWHRWRDVVALPRWLEEQYAGKMDVKAVRSGPKGVAKQIFIGMRESDLDPRYLKNFVELARHPQAGESPL